jgi:hypothetical protein
MNAQWSTEWPSKEVQGLRTAQARPSHRMAECREWSLPCWRRDNPLGEYRERLYAVATLRPLDPAAAAPIPDLYEQVLIGFFTLALRLRGFERVEATEGHFSVVQEWHCELA